MLLSVVALLVVGLIAGPTLFFILLVNQPDDLGQNITNYRLFVLLMSGIVSLSPLTFVTILLGRHRQRLIRVIVFGLVFPILGMSVGAVYAALQVWR